MLLEFILIFHFHQNLKHTIDYSILYYITYIVTQQRKAWTTSGRSFLFETTHNQIIFELF